MHIYLYITVNICSHHNGRIYWDGDTWLTDWLFSFLVLNRDYIFQYYYENYDRANFINFNI
jgi:hypothetical protein